MKCHSHVPHYAHYLFYRTRYSIPRLAPRHFAIRRHRPRICGRSQPSRGEQLARTSPTRDAGRCRGTIGKLESKSVAGFPQATYTHYELRGHDSRLRRTGNLTPGLRVAHYLAVAAKALARTSDEHPRLMTDVD